MKTDMELKKDVLDELKWQPTVDAADIGVSVEDGVVTLRGEVSSIPQKWAAERAVKRVYGVKALAEEIEVNLPGSSQRNDTDIAQAAGNALKWNISVSQDRVKAKVQDGWITLTGEVDWWYQRRAAENAVHHLTGVKGVSNLITIKPKVKAFEVKDKIINAFKRNARLDAQKIQVETSGGRVILRGSVHSWAERDDAVDAAWAAPGVSAVESHIKVVV